MHPCCSSKRVLSVDLLFKLVANPTKQVSANLPISLLQIKFGTLHTL